MAVKTGVSMISFVITKEMRRKATSNSYKLPKAKDKQQVIIKVDNISYFYVLIYIFI